MSKDGFIVNDDMFGAYVKVPTGANGDMHTYKVIGRIGSNGYCDVPVMGGMKMTPHSEIVPVLNVVHCGVSEDTVIRVALSDCEVAQPPNNPLTLEELREMDGEPVWISYLNSAKGKYHIVRAFGKNSIVFEEYDKEFGPYKSLFLGNYGKNWLAYRRKPESLET